jgi:hypothetical protein
MTMKIALTKTHAATIRPAMAAGYLFLFAAGLVTWLILCSLAAGAETPQAKDAKPPKVITLFDGKSLKNWKILDKIDFDGHGEVTVKDGELILGMGRPMTGVKWAGQELPRINYEVTLEARRLEGSDFFCGMTFPVKDSHCSLILGGWGGSLTGLSSLDGFDASENETTGSVIFKEKKWYKIRLRVTKERIEAWLDDDQIVDVKIEGRKISLRWEMDPMPPFGIGNYATKSGIKNVVMRVLDE